MNYKYRYIQEILSTPPSHFRTVLITGPRRSGKSTLAKVLLKQWGGGSYVSFDTPAEQARFSSDPEGFLRSLDLPAVLDEVQNVPDLFSYLKKVVDEQADAGCQYILTGSQQFQMMKHVTESLAGRILIKELLPFAVAESKQEPADRIKHNLNSLLEHNNKFLMPEVMVTKSDVIEEIASGGYPPIKLLSSKQDAYEWFNSYFETYIQRDLRSLSNLQNLALFSRFVSLVAGRTGQLINYSELGKDIGVNYKTCQHYLSLLEASYLWRTVKPYFVSGSEKRIIKSPKGYFLDTGLAMFLIGLQQAGLERNPLYGNLFETFVVSEFFKLKILISLNISFSHFCINRQGEVDLIIEAGTNIIPIEIKASATPDSDWNKGIKLFKSTTGLPENYPSYVISLHPHIIPLGNGTTNLPLQLFI